MRNGVPKGWWVLVPLGFVLLILTHLMALIFRIQPAVSLWFPPSGVAIALTLWLGPVGAILTWMASFLMSPFWGNDGWYRLASWTDATEPLVAWFVYRQYWKGTRNLSSLRDAAFFILAAPISACATSAVLGSLMLLVMGKMSAPNLDQSIINWWLGNAIGTMAIAPPALLVLSPILQKRGFLEGEDIKPKSPRLRRTPRYCAEIMIILVFSLATAILTVYQAKGTGFAFQQFSFLNFITIIWAATRFGARGGTLTSSFCVLSTVVAYLFIYPNAIELSTFPVNPEVLHVHKLSLLVQCTVSLLLGTATTEQAATQVALAVEKVRAAEYEARAELTEKLAQLNHSLEETNARLQQSNRDKDQLLKREQAARDVSEAARSAAEAANRMKDDFLAILSHELRSPLNPILGWARLLRTRKHDSATIDIGLETIERNAKLQTKLIEDLLDVSRILRGKLSLSMTTVNLESVIKGAIETVQMSADAKSIDLRFSIKGLGTSYWGQVTGKDSSQYPIPNPQSPFTILGDANRLQQVVWNLLTNAVKFTPNGGRVEISLSIEDEGERGGEGDKGDRCGATSVGGQGELSLGTSFSAIAPTHQALIRVSDTGKGINPDFLPYVFERFRQADSSTTRNFGGLGLGLAIVRHIVDLHDGTVWAESLGENQGATFTVKLPLLEPTQINQENKQPLSFLSPPPPLSPSPPPALTGVKILMVDDETDARDLISFMLEQYGAVVTAVPSASLALEVLPQIHPDVLLSDIGMPEIDGYMLIRQIRSLQGDRGGQIPAIALTAYAGESDRQRILAAGFQMHISKPVDSTKLVEAIAQIICSRH